MNSKIAHVKKNATGDWGEPHALKDHLQGVAELSRGFADLFNSGDWGYAAGIAHDAGKDCSEWQRYLCRKSGYDADAHLEGKPGKLEHSCHGAKLVEELFGKGIGRVLGYCIAGHHAGLPDWYPDESGGRGALSFRLQKTNTDNLSAELKSSVTVTKPARSPWDFSKEQPLALSLWVRMLFSCLVDADFLDTETYMGKDRAKQRGNYLSMAELLGRFNLYMAGKIAGSNKTHINKLRQEVLSDCRNAAALDPGIFSLTVPTGGGKTLSSLAFALEHAVKYKKRRIIYVIPYTSIIEQNADVFKAAVGDDQVIEHHSNYDEDGTTLKARLAAENWDAPIIVTTSVQFFESLFSAKPSRCRKLHNIVGSVVVLDEAQLVPSEYLTPILQTMDILSRRYGVSFVIATATQPAFETREGFKGLPANSVREIIKDVPKLYKELQRVGIEMPRDWAGITNWTELAPELLKERQVLCVVTDRKSCRELHKLMPQGTYHLSALMCGEHRSEVIAEIKKKLKSGEPVRVISTQLVEAGVDIDFPVVYRALAGLDSIAQASGRCNREGGLSGKGRVIVFNPPKKSPPGILRKAAEAALNMLKTGLKDPLDYSVFDKFFADLYWKVNSLDSKGIVDLLKPDQRECGMQFRTAAEKFRIIDDKAQKSILVRYGEGNKLIGMLKSMGPERWLLRKLQRYSVNVYSGDFANLLNQRSVEEIVPNIFAITTSMQYDKVKGLLVDEIPDDPEAFIL